jgi:hypothetical protein
MPKKPHRRRDAPATAANDNSRNARLTVPFAWDVYRAAARADEAMAIEFRTDIRAS